MKSDARILRSRVSLGDMVAHPENPSLPKDLPAA